MYAQDALAKDQVDIKPSPSTDDFQIGDPMKATQSDLQESKGSKGIIVLLQHGLLRVRSA